MSYPLRAPERMRCGARARLAVSLLLLTLGCAPEPAPRPVVLVVVDTLRADRLSVYGAARPTSPALGRHAQRAAVFEHAFATSPWTAPSVGSLLTGTLPSRHGLGDRVDPQQLTSFGSLQQNLPTLGERLEARGFATAAIVNNPFLAPGSGAERGFGRYDHEPTTLVEIRRSVEVAEAALRWIAQHGDDPRLFLFVHLMDPHMAYDPPPAVRGRFTRGIPTRLSLPFTDLDAVRSGELALSRADRAFVRRAYDEEILGLDAGLDLLLGGLEARGVLREGLVILTADHGEEHWEHGGFEHGHSLAQEVMRVPLLVWGRGVQPRRIDAPVSGVDVVPTVLDALGLAVPEQASGASLWPLLQGGAPPPPRDLVAEHPLYGPERQAIVRWPWKLERVEGEPALHLHQLEADPGERRDVAAEQPERVASLVQALDAALARAHAARGAAAAAPIAPETRQDLRSLGYVD